MIDLIPEFKRDETKDYLKVLKAVKSLPFPVGKTLLLDFLKGNMKNKSIINNRMNDFEFFDTLEDYDKDEVTSLIDSMISKSFLEVTRTDNNPYLKVIKLTSKGEKELINPKPISNKIHTKVEITDSEKEQFKELDSFLNGFNDYQKKSIISSKSKIICIAGAGSGKTQSLTKRIEFLIKYKGIKPEKILAITFTRKARQEMTNRLLKLGFSTNIETFNSFSEKILQKYHYKIYSKPIRVITYGNKVMAIMSALDRVSLKMNSAIDLYFTESQKKFKTQEQLSNIFMSDCFNILEYFKSKNSDLYDFSVDADPKDVKIAKIIFNICKYLKEYMNMHGLRDYTDQILDTIKFFKSNNEFIPKFDHILIDEYQDVNAMQIELIDLLNPPNLFVVGDPRQSIFGWRGSDINYILKFQEKYPESELITLTKNYRSNNHIVEFMNLSIKEMDLPPLEFHKTNNKKEIKLIGFSSESEEFNFIIDEIKKTEVPRDEIFILSRTNRQLVELSQLLKSKGIKHLLKTDDNNNIIAQKDELILATIHSIKGLESELVFLIGANEQNFPCKATDHPVIELIKVDEYDKEDEEKRLFYVAISRAKNKLIISYTGKKPTYFINPEMMNFIGLTESSKKDEPFKKSYVDYLDPDEDKKDDFKEYYSWRDKGSYKPKTDSWDDMISD